MSHPEERYDHPRLPTLTEHENRRRDAVSAERLAFLNVVRAARLVCDRRAGALADLREAIERADAALAHADACVFGPHHEPPPG